VSSAALDLPDRPAELFAGILDAGQRGDDPYPWYARLRALEPIHPTDAFTTRRSWVLTRHADALAVLGNPRLRQDSRAAQIFDVGPPGASFVEMMSLTIMYQNPVDHDRIRGMVSRSFTPRAIGQRRSEIARVVDGLLAQSARRRSMDMVEDFAYPLPIYVICQMLGVPQSDVPRFLVWAHDFARRGDVSALDPEVIRRGEAATAGFADYFTRLGQLRRADPGDDLLSAIVCAEAGGRRLTDAEVAATCVILLQAGHETTADLTSMGTLALLRQRDQLELLRREPGLIRPAVEELIRYDTSVQISQRVAHEDVRLQEGTVPEGDVFVVLNGAANRDPARFPEPDRLDLRRPDNAHLGFGLGRHVCLGASLARAELQVALGEVVQRFPALELAGEPRWRPSLFLRGLASLPLRW
jgi:cytochrome P450